MAAKKRSKQDAERRVTWRLDPRNHEYLADEAERLGLRSLNAALNVVLSQVRAGGSKPAKGRKKH
jgi:hypothetical protein